jgi:hypothetical protein
MQALVFGFADVVCAEDILQRVGVVGYDLASVDKAHALRTRLGGHDMLDLEAQLSDGGGCGEVLKTDATFDLAGGRQDLQVECQCAFCHVGSRCRLAEGRVDGGEGCCVFVYVAVNGPVWSLVSSVLSQTGHV